jgi:transcriptional regulator with XRE-family HTH domain
MAKAFGELFKSLRIESRQTLRVFCLENKFDPGNISKLERGRLSPPRAVEKLEEYARALKLKPDSSEWSEFIDLGLTCAGQIPKELLSDEELVGKLPAFLRTLSGKKLTTRQLEELMETIRRA